MHSSFKIALVLCALLALWLISGIFSGEETKSADTSESAEKQAVSVRVIESHAYESWDEVVVYGTTEASKRVMLRAEASGTVEAIVAHEGATIEQGKTILKLDAQDRKAALQYAEALVRQRQIEYKAAKSLAERGYQGKIGLATAEAQLDAAKAQLSQSKIALDHTIIRAPFAGMVDAIDVEIGDYIDAGKTIVATLIQRDPLKVVGQIPERQIAGVSEGLTARVKLATGQAVDGKVIFASRVADSATRTFRVEVEIPNPTGDVADGLTAEIMIPVERVPVHKLSSSVLSLDDSGVIGVKIVKENGVVEFIPVSVVRDTEDGVEVTGLPEVAQVITLGQAFVREGQRVRVSMVPESSDR